MGWFDGTNLFDVNVSWVAFTADGHFFSPVTLGWLGRLNKGSALDHHGKPVAWLAGTIPTGILDDYRPAPSASPLPPSRPLTPMTPFKPASQFVPNVGWSPLTWTEWLKQR